MIVFKYKGSLAPTHDFLFNAKTGLFVDDGQEKSIHFDADMNIHKKKVEEYSPTPKGDELRWMQTKQIFT
ncbi:MAG: hypothetical protein F6K39_36095 [Okeania sp. SIO3B3]|nr:hypothetical protein [Okeania sp. SIO3B3]